MGILSKVWKKTVGKVWKKTGKMIKSAVMKIGKFMNKIGVVGQIALGLILPGIGSALGTWAGTASTNFLAAGAKSFINAAIQVGTKASAVFKTVTQGMMKTVGETVGAVLNRIPGMDGIVKNVTGKLGMNAGNGIDIKGMTFNSAKEVAEKALTDISKAGGDLFSKNTLTGLNKYAVEDNLKKSVMKDLAREGTVFKDSGTTTFKAVDGAEFEIPNAPSFELKGPPSLSDKIDLSVNQSIDYTKPLSEQYSILGDPTKIDMSKVDLGINMEDLGVKEQLLELPAEKTARLAAEETLNEASKNINLGDKGFFEKAKDKAEGAVITTGLQAVGLQESMTPIDQRRSFSNTTVLDNSQTQMFTSDSSMLNSSLSTFMGGNSSNFGGQIGHSAFLYNSEQADMEFQRSLAAQQGGVV